MWHFCGRLDLGSCVSRPAHASFCDVLAYPAWAMTVKRVRSLYRQAWRRMLHTQAPKTTFARWTVVSLLDLREANVFKTTMEWRSNFYCYIYVKCGIKLYIHLRVCVHPNVYILLYLIFHSFVKYLWSPTVCHIYGTDQNTSVWVCVCSCPVLMRCSFTYFTNI